MNKQIKTALEQLLIDYPENIDVVSVLNSQIVTAYNCEWENGELETFLKGENDVTDGLEQESTIYEDIRDIQDMIICDLRDR